MFCKAENILLLDDQKFLAAVDWLVITPTLVTALLVYLVLTYCV